MGRDARSPPRRAHPSPSAVRRDKSRNLGRTTAICAVRTRLRVATVATRASATVGTRPQLVRTNASAGVIPVREAGSHAPHPTRHRNLPAAVVGRIVAAAVGAIPASGAFHERRSAARSAAWTTLDRNTDGAASGRGARRPCPRRGTKRSRRAGGRAGAQAPPRCTLEALHSGRRDGIADRTRAWRARAAPRDRAAAQARRPAVAPCLSAGRRRGTGCVGLPSAWRGGGRARPGHARPQPQPRRRRASLAASRLRAGAEA